MHTYLNTDCSNYTVYAFFYSPKDKWGKKEKSVSCALMLSDLVLLVHPTKEETN